MRSEHEPWTPQCDEVRLAWWGEARQRGRAGGLWGRTAQGGGGQGGRGCSQGHRQARRDEERKFTAGPGCEEVQVDLVGSRVGDSGEREGGEGGRGECRLWVGGADVPSGWIQDRRRVGSTDAGRPSWGKEELGRISTSSQAVSPPSPEARKDDSFRQGFSRAPHNPRITCAVGVQREGGLLSGLGSGPASASRDASLPVGVQIEGPA